MKKYLSVKNRLSSAGNNKLFLEFKPKVRTMVWTFLWGGRSNWVSQTSSSVGTVRKRVLLSAGGVEVFCEFVSESNDWSVDVKAWTRFIKRSRRFKAGSIFWIQVHENSWLLALSTTYFSSDSFPRDSGNASLFSSQ